MKLYTIKRGKFYSTGSRPQPILFPIGIFLAGIISSLIFGNILPVLVSLIPAAIILLNLKKKTIVYSRRVNFTNSCVYKLSENYDQVNKLFGFSEGYHHWNSARFGWRCTDGENIELLAYCYVNGKRVIQPLLKCKPGTWVFCNIQNKDSEYVFKTFNEKGKLATARIEKEAKKSIYGLFKLFIYNLYPYFGGKIPAPRNMNIYMIPLK